MKVLKYSKEWEDWLVITDKEFEAALPEWMNKNAVFIPRLNKILSLPGLFPAGDLKAWEGKDLYIEIECGRIIGHRKSDNSFSKADFYTTSENDRTCRWEWCNWPIDLFENGKLKEGYMPIDEFIVKHGSNGIPLPGQPLP